MDRSIRRSASIAALALVASVVLSTAGPVAAADEHASTASPGEATSRAAFHDAMRKLWEDHITWTRLYIVGATSGPTDLPDLQATTDRLLANQVDIGDAIKPYYGDAAGEQLTALLSEHILVAAEVIGDAETGDTAALDDAIGRWHTNGDDIATFLSSANPEAWPLDLMKGHMRTHLDLTQQEAVAHLEGRHEESVNAYDKVHAQILAMADMLSEGIASQFPDQFSD